MILEKCTFDQLPSAMQMHVLYSEKIPVAEYRLAIWSKKDTLYYNDLKESEVERFVTLMLFCKLNDATNITLNEAASV